MLTNLHVKNLALIDETEIEFTGGLNVLTGETGAGKSILLGSVNLALGAKAAPDIIGNYGDSALVELSFLVDEEKAKELENLDIYPEEGIVTISRRIFDGKSIIKVNGESTTASNVRKITELLIDIHGQHEHQSLLKKSVHLDIIDRYARKELEKAKKELINAYKKYKDYESELNRFTISEDERLRNISFLKYEIEEIENANLKENEDIELEKEYRRIVNSKKITDELDFIEQSLSTGTGSASELVSRAIQSLNRILDYDDKLKTMYDELSDVENLLNDFNREMASYLSLMEFDEKYFAETEKRLDLINSLKAKHGGSLESIFSYCMEAKERLEFYKEYEKNLSETQIKYEKSKNEVFRLCIEVSSIRKNYAKQLEKEIISALKDLNFLQVKFEIRFDMLANPTKNGIDEACFMISLNPGEEMKELSKIASGGELSRIMLGIKSVLAGRDDIDSLIFDEIDTGISGRTAQKVSEKMAVIAKKHQVICITHLPQIAAMADTHFLIEKNVVSGKSRTEIHKLSDDETITELSRMLGGTEITDIVKDNAREMKKQADELKNMSV